MGVRSGGIINKFTKLIIHELVTYTCGSLHFSIFHIFTISLFRFLQWRKFQPYSDSDSLLHHSIPSFLLLPNLYHSTTLSLSLHHHLLVLVFSVSPLKQLIPPPVMIPLSSSLGPTTIAVTSSISDSS